MRKLLLAMVSLMMTITLIGCQGGGTEMTAHKEEYVRELNDNSNLGTFELLQVSQNQNDYNPAFPETQYDNEQEPGLTALYFAYPDTNGRIMLTQLYIESTQYNVFGVHPHDSIADSIEKLNDYGYLPFPTEEYSVFGASEDRQRIFQKGHIYIRLLFDNADIIKEIRITIVDLSASSGDRML